MIYVRRVTNAARPHLSLRDDTHRPFLRRLPGRITCIGRERFLIAVRAAHRRQLRQLFGRVPADDHAELVVLAECISQSDRRGDTAAQHRLIDQFERALRASGVGTASSENAEPLE